MRGPKFFMDKFLKEDISLRLLKGYSQVGRLKKKKMYLWHWNAFLVRGRKQMNF